MMHFYPSNQFVIEILYLFTSFTYFIQIAAILTDSNRLCNFHCILYVIFSIVHTLENSDLHLPSCLFSFKFYEVNSDPEHGQHPD